MGEVIILPVVTKLDIPAERVVNSAVEAKLKDVVVIGFDGEGALYFASSYADGGDVLWMMELAKKALLEIE